MQLKTCNKCKIEKTCDEFYKNNKGRFGVGYTCKTCSKEYRNAYRMENIEKIKKYKSENADKIKQHRKVYLTENREVIADKLRLTRIRSRTNPITRSKHIFNAAKTRAAKKNIKFTICVEHVICLMHVGKCNKTGIKFDLSRANTFINPFSPSLDRIDNNRGYEPDNIQLVCNMYNSGKGENSEVDFQAICLAIVKNMSDDEVNTAKNRLLELES